MSTLHHEWQALGALLIAALAAALCQKLLERKPYRAKKLMSDAEKDAYGRLTQALPGKLVFAQVQLSRFIEPKRGLRRSWYNRIAQLSADFVICEPDMSVAAVVEIDDRTHEHEVQKRRDRKKDRACDSAGIKLLRWRARALPSAQEIHKRLSLDP